MYYFNNFSLIFNYLFPFLDQRICKIKVNNFKIMVTIIKYIIHIYILHFLKKLDVNLIIFFKILLHHFGQLSLSGTSYKQKKRQ